MKLPLVNKILHNKILKETSWAFLTKGVTFVLFYVFSIYIARAMGVDLYGQWSFFFSVITVVFTLSYFGINVATKRYVAQYSGTKQISSVLKSAVWLRFIFSLAFSLVFLLVHQWLADILGRSELSSVFLWACPLIFFTGFVEFTKDVFVGFHRIKYNFIVNIFEFGSRLVLALLFFTFSVSLFSVLESFIISSVIAGVVGIFLIYRIYYIRPKVRVKAAFIRDIWKYSFPLFFTAIAFVFATEVDNIMLGLLRSEYDVGIYSIAKQFTEKLPHISTAIAMGTLPLFGKFSQDNKKKLNNLFKKLLRLNTYIFVPLCLVLALTAPYFVPLLYGEQYLTAITPLQILLIHLLCSSFFVFTCGILDYRGLAKIRAWISPLSIGLNIALNFYLIPKWGAVGETLGTVLADLPATFLYYYFAKKSLA